MFHNRLLAGLHQGEDLSQEKVVVEKAGGVTEERHPSKTWKRGEIVLSEDNLEEKFGSEKFRCLNPKKKKAANKKSFGEQVNEDGDTLRKEQSKPIGKVPLDEDESLPDDETVDTSELSEDDEEPKTKTLEEKYGRLEDLTVEQLQKIAEKENIDLQGATRKKTILSVLIARG